MQVALPGGHSFARLVSKPRLTEQEYFDFCSANPDLRIERNPQGEIVIVPPAGIESDYRSNKVAAQLDRWAEKDGRGKAFGSSAQFLLPDGSALSPDAAWVSNETLAAVPRNQRKKFAALSPEFVVEVMSPSDRPKQAKAKMELWISNGVQLAWLIDGDAETVYVYRIGQTAKTRRGLREISGEGPVKGFTLPLQAIWEGLG